jgi:hypothetical protein
MATFVIKQIIRNKKIIDRILVINSLLFLLLLAYDYYYGNTINFPVIAG